jgi:uncharacterized protein YbjQ (UPF0145 family)
MLLTTTNTIEGQPIRKYLGIVTGEVILGVNIFRDITASISNVIGGRTRSYENSLVEARDQAMQEMQDAAQRLGANAVIGIDLDYESMGQTGMLMVTATGTAVVIG